MCFLMFILLLFSFFEFLMFILVFSFVILSSDVRNAVAFVWYLIPLLNVLIVLSLQAWLDPVNLPQGEDIMCGICRNPLHFVLQVSWEK